MNYVQYPGRVDALIYIYLRFPINNRIVKAHLGELLYSMAQKGKDAYQSENFRLQ